MSTPVKRRPYDASRRRAAAEQRRTAVLDAARRRMLEDGYAATTVASIAADAGVSAETVYKAFGGKAGLVTALYREALSGPGPESAEVRSDRLRSGSSIEIVAGWAELASQVAPRVVPILRLVRDAAADPELRALHEEFERSRLDRMRDNAAALVAHRDVRAGLTVEEAGDLLYAISSPEMYELLVLRQGWSLRRYGDLVRDTITAALLR